jgi:hypothetical protein
MAQAGTKPGSVLKEPSPLWHHGETVHAQQFSNSLGHMRHRARRARGRRRIKQAWRGTEHHSRATDGDLERHAVRKYSRLHGLATAAIRDDGDHLEDHCARVFGDAKCSPETLLFTVDFGGDYELGANSSTVTGAQETRFSFVCYVREVHRVALQQGAERG